MNKTPINQQDDFESDDLLPEYNFDYTKARPNRFATISENKITVILDPDVAKVFQTSEAVNRALRCLLSAIPEK
ncbi:hypothetical protein MEN41_03985 [Dolichospermum sp. ST_con]|jgi:hypothetical protein|nr:hypothetical protein [Dolichospermum sp. ST_con]MDD1417916.1 hypothetical protein [Dolichospermum sp. ST_sed1]MDD1423863.1 hypothetical protein [Dolichospermum sp. ST_sed9]MDD1429666.1 hypothetical protein [Dolichospermum sp. ST_sed6]MDD1435925.1 hypothetical protein [Dolichospermum sp. ST_sed10]MDD1439303.1 hypothetical protein [Dolichospermum sp. ST_sed3]MDD1445085.1 hypothetical protein [Dolichospermum sp. ST_sed8]MDD1455487.1 hypothetical protein [Dolichospermum sp. ST_sed7]MDD145928